MSTFNLNLLAANRQFYNGPCESVTVPAVDGDMQFLAGHSSMVAAIVPGALRFRLPGGGEQIVAVGAGVVRVTGSEVVVLVDTAERPEEIDASQYKRDMDEALEAIRQKQSIREYKLAQANLARAASNLRIKRNKFVN